ncbi:MAG TPA: acetyl-CoA carboxylase biotin carboxylase subunit [Candidatus Binataceae bacterium]|nr:acetyl-CoA carboxylase biotin carboxylase subunit [Candidatus Binataceae bacterium]
MFKKLLVANRGTIAIRIIRACRELGIPTVAVYSTADKQALHVRMADESVCIGPPAAADSYLSIPSILSAAVAYGADAVHPGYGFLSENGDFAEACQRSGLQFVGPRARHIRLMGDKPRARRIMKRAGVPILPGSEGTGVTDLREAQAHAKAIGYPVLIKAAAGGGGKGMRIARDASELTRLFPLARGESEAAFGSGKMYFEKFLERARHVEFQIVADSQRNVIHLGERDCSLQRRHQKVLEESPCPVLDARLREKMGRAAVRAAEVVGYSNVGTVEFLLAENGGFYFIEMNTRIQVEHGVTEMVTGIDLVKESLLLAMGERLRFKQKQIQLKGASLECRIYAEDPETGLPSPGVVTSHHPPGGLGVRIETALYSGYRVPVHYDPLVAKLIAHADNRQLAIARTRAALREYMIDGIKTNIPLHLKILDDPDFQRGQVATDFLSRFAPPEREHPAPRAARS